MNGRSDNPRQPRHGTDARPSSRAGGASRTSSGSPRTPSDASRISLAGNPRTAGQGLQPGVMRNAMRGGRSNGSGATGAAGSGRYAGQSTAGSQRDQALRTVREAQIARTRARGTNAQPPAPRRQPAGAFPAAQARAPRKRRKLPAISVIALLAIAVCAVIFWPRGYVSPYHWESLSWTGERPVYYEDGAPASKFGIDVSAHEGDIDWQAVANDGVEFAFIRLGWRGYTEGGLNIDANFEANFAGAKAAGLPVGVYFFSQAINAEEAREEADLVLATLNGAQLELPIAFDHESVSDTGARANSLGMETATRLANTFCERIEEAGYQAIVYGNISDMARFSGESVFGDDARTRPAWVAQYGRQEPTAEFDFCIWQYSETGRVAGISHDVDLNIWFTNTLPLSTYRNSPDYTEPE